MARFNIDAARKAGYSQSEIDDYMGKNNLVATGQPDTQAARTLSSIEKIPILGSILSPATKATRFAGETVAQAGRTLLDPAFFKAQFNPTGLTPAEADYIQKQNKTFLMPEKSIETPTDILKSGARATAGAMSYAVPGGATLKGALGAGAVMGGLAAASDDESNLKSIIGGAAGGAGGAGIGYGITKGAGKLLDVAGKQALTRADDLTLKGIRPSPSQVTNFEKDTGQVMKDVIKKYGFYDRGSDQVEKTITPLQQYFDDIATSTSKTVKKEDVTKAFAEQIQQYRSSSLPEVQKKGDDLMIYATNLLKKAPDDVSLGMLTGQRREVDKLIKDFKFDPTVATKNEAIRNLLQDMVRKGAGDATAPNGMNITQLGKELQALRALEPIAERQGNLGKGAQSIGLGDILSLSGGGGVGALTAGVPGALVGGAMTYAVRKAANSPIAARMAIRGLESTSPLLEKGAQKTLEYAGSKPNILPNAFIGSDLGRYLFGLGNKEPYEGNGNEYNRGEKERDPVASEYNADKNPTNQYRQGSGVQFPSSIGVHSPTIPQSPQTATQGADDMVEIYDNIDKKTLKVPRSQLGQYGIQADGQGQEAPSAAPTGITKEKIGQAMLMDLLTTGGKNIQELKTIGNYIGTDVATAKKLPASVENRVQLAKSGLRALDTVEEELSKNGLAPALQAIPGQPGARLYDSSTFRAVEGLLRARSGAAIPEIEVRRYMAANLPKVGDSQETIKAKLKAFRQDLEDISRSGGASSLTDLLGTSMATE